MTYLVCLLLAVSATDPKTDDEKSLYAIGYLIGSRNLARTEHIDVQAEYLGP